MFIQTNYTRKDILVGIATRLRTGWFRVLVPRGANYSSLPQNNHTTSGVHPASYSMGARDSFVGVKRPGREVDHSPPSSAGLTNDGSYTSNPLHDFMPWTDQLQLWFFGLLCRLYTWRWRSWGPVPRTRTHSAIIRWHYLKIWRLTGH